MILFHIFLFVPDVVLSFIILLLSNNDILLFNRVDISIIFALIDVSISFILLSNYTNAVVITSSSFI